MSATLPIRPRSHAERASRRSRGCARRPNDVRASRARAASSIPAAAAAAAATVLRCATLHQVPVTGRARTVAQAQGRRVLCNRGAHLQRRNGGQYSYRQTEARPERSSSA
eukprot:1534125-Pleurochrysis_carterae.AAC.4